MSDRLELLKMFLRGFLLLLFACSLIADDLSDARNAQNLDKLKQLAAASDQAAQKSAKDAAAQYRSAMAHYVLAEVALEKNEKKLSGAAGETGIAAARRAVELQQGNSEYHRILGTLCGQVIPANLMLAFKYGKCALEEVNKAVELDGKSALNYLSRGVGNFYLPAQFGGSVEKALADFDKVISLQPKLADAYLWKGMALRKLNRKAEARAAIEKSLTLNPQRVWAKEQLAKTPAQ